MKLIAFLLLAGAALAQTTNYPGSIDSDSSLFVVADNVQTTLSTAMATTDTVAIVASSTGFVPNMIATICDSSTNTGKCTAFEHMFVTAVAGNVLTVTRGFAGTTARSHSSGRTVNILIDSAHQTALKKAVIAIETSLGPNLSNIGQLPFLNSQTYAFAPLASGSGVTVSGGNLVNGNNTLTFATVPPGVNGTDVGHSLYFSGGTGGPQACLITGGSGQAGQSNGQIIVNCPGAQSGAWSVGSATGGLAESISALPAAGGGVFVTCGVPVTLYAGMIITKNLVLQGCGNSSMLKMASGLSISSVISVNTAGIQVVLQNLVLDGNRSSGAVISDVISVIGTSLNPPPVLTATGNTIQNFVDTGTTMRLRDVVGCKVTGNSLLNNSGHGIWAEQTAGPAATGHNISGNRIQYAMYNITGCSNTSPPVCTLQQSTGFYTGGQQAAVAQTTVPAYNQQVNFRPSGSGPPYSQVSLTGITASGSSTGGVLIEGNIAIELSAQQFSTAIGNTLIGGGYDISNGSANIIFSGNTSSYSNDAGLTIEGTSAAPTQLINVSDFSVNFPFFEGIIIGDYAIDVSLQNAAFANAGYGKVVNRQSGVSVVGIHNARNRIQSGRIEYSGNYGILIQGSSGTTIANVSMNNNTSGPISILDSPGNVNSTSFNFTVGTDAVNYSAISNTLHFSNGSTVYCADCNPTCTAGASNGRTCFLENNVWVH